MVEGLPNINFSKGVCEGCVLGKHPREKFDTGKTHRASSPLDLIHRDLMGSFPHPSIKKARYVLTFIDDFSRYTWMYLLRNKSEVFVHFENFKALVKTQSERKIKALLIDNGGEYVNTRLQNLCLQSNIQLQYIVPYTPQQNGVPERKNLSLKEMASCMLYDNLIIERSVKFVESLLHVPQLLHADTFYLPHVRDDDSIHSNADIEHADAAVEHVDGEAKSSDTYPMHAYHDPHLSPDRASNSESNSPIINQRTRSLREIYAQDHPTAINGLVRDNSDLHRTSLEFIEPPLALTSTEPSPSWHCHLVQYSDPQSYVEAIGHPSWEFALEEEYNSLLENQTLDLVPLASRAKIV
eukprot:PITA_02029